MKKITLTILTVVASLAFMNCSSDDDKGQKKQECIDCEIMGSNSTYCYTEGDTFYTINSSGESDKVPLEGASWSDAKMLLKELCN